MTWTRWSMVVYAVAMVALGLVGTLKANEIMSLVGGGGAGLVVLGCMFWSLKNPRPGYIVALVVGLAVGVQFFMKFSKSGLVYPHLLIALLNVALIVCLLGGHMLSMAAKKRETA